MLRNLLVTLTAVGVLLAGGASAQGRDQLWDRCQLVDENGRPRPGTTPDLAVAACTAIIQSEKESAANLAKAFVNRGFAYGAKGQVDRAIQDYSQAILVDPNNALAFDDRGAAYAGKGQYERAIQDYDQAILLDPNDANAFDNRGTAYKAAGQLDRAIQDYDQAIRLDPNFTIAFINRGGTYDLRGRYSLAIQDLDQAIRLEPNNAFALNNRGNAYRDTGQFDLAIRDYDQAIRLYPNFLLFLDNRGVAYEGKGQYDRAIQDFDEVIRADPNDAGPLFSRGLAKLYGRGADVAIDDLAEMVRLRPDFAYGALWLDIARRRAGQDGKAEFAKNSGRIAPGKWPAPVVAFYLGKASRESVYAAANQGDDTTRLNQSCEADFYLAEDDLSTGARAAAQALFQRAADHCPLAFIESWAARAELARVGG